MKECEDIDDIVRNAYRRICQPEDDWVDEETWPYDDHGHTDCWIIGGLLRERRSST